MRKTKTLKNALSTHYDRSVTVRHELPHLHIWDARVIEMLEPCTEITLWLIDDGYGVKSIVRDDNGGLTAIQLDATPEDQLALAAWNADFGLKALLDHAWIDRAEYNNLMAIADRHLWC